MAFVIVGATLQTSAFHVSHLIIGRIITGLGTGIDSSTVPMYQSELCAKEKRGRLISTEILFIGIGIVMAVRLQTFTQCSPNIDRLSTGSTSVSNTYPALLHGADRSPFSLSSLLVSSSSFLACQNPHVGLQHAAVKTRPSKFYALSLIVSLTTLSSLNKSKPYARLLLSIDALALRRSRACSRMADSRPDDVSSWLGLDSSSIRW